MTCATKPFTAWMKSVLYRVRSGLSHHASVVCFCPLVGCVIASGQRQSVTWPQRKIPPKFRLQFHCLQQPSAIQVHVETYINTWRSCRGQIYPIFLCTPALRGRQQPAWSLPPSGSGSDGKDESSMARCPSLLISIWLIVAFWLLTGSVVSHFPRIGSFFLSFSVLNSLDRVFLAGFNTCCLVLSVCSSNGNNTHRQ